jgi:hypothetical protein
MFKVSPAKQDAELNAQPELPAPDAILSRLL